MAGKGKKYSVLGTRQPRIDGPLRATGRSQFTDDVVLPGMLYGKIVRSPLARGRIVNIDTSKAESMAGVKAVITHKDSAGLTIGSDQPLLCADRVNYVGDEIAAVAAVDEDIAAEAAGRITVDYEPMEAVFSMEEAVAEGAPVIHEDHKDNCVDEFCTDYGDVDQAFSRAQHIRVGQYAINPTHNCFAEHHVVLADHSLPGKLSIWTPNQAPIRVQKAMAGPLGLSESDVRVFSLNTGGAFSGRVGARNHHFIAAMLSKKASRPVKIRCTADEEFIVYRGGGRHKYEIKTGVMKDGTLIATTIDLLMDCGAYMELMNKIYPLYSPFPTMFYKLDAARFGGKFVYTNNPPRAIHHGGGFVGLRFAVEAELDLIAQDLGMDPVEIRLKNAVDKGYTSIANLHFGSCGLKESVRKSSKQSGWKKKYGKLPPYKGIGIGCGGINAGGKGALGHDTSAAFIKIGEDGKPVLFTGLPDLGQGSHTAMAMIAAETLGINTGDITVVSGDTDVDPLDGGAFTQRGTITTGNAVKAACLDAKKQLAKTASTQLGVRPSALVFRDKKIYPKKAPEKAIKFEEVVYNTLHCREGRYVMGRGFYNPPSESITPLVSSPAFSFGAQVAEVEVNPETGVVKLVRMTVAHDIGFAINPLALEGQMDGQVFSGMGQTLYEESCIKNGRVMNPSVLGYKLPRPFEMPEVAHIMVETNDPNGPFGAKEVGEGPIWCTAPAIAGAVSNAIGCRITELPITPDRVLTALRQKKKDLEA